MSNEQNIADSKLTDTKKNPGPSSKQEKQEDSEESGDKPQSSVDEEFEKLKKKSAIVSVE